MPIPDFQTLMLPMLELAGDGNEHSVSESRGHLAERFGLTEEERRRLLPSGQQTTFDNRVAWAKSYLEKAGLLQKTRRAHFKISDSGQRVLSNPPQKIDTAFLRQFSEFAGFRSANETSEEEIATQATPEEALEAAYGRIREDLAIALLEQIHAGSSEFFERIVLDLMLKMGYGGSREGAGLVTNLGADAGIDGIINEDQLGLDVIYLQAKRWQNTVGRPEIQKFVGALHGQRAKKGVFLTASTFSQEAMDYVASIESKVVLIDGMRLAQLMIDFNVGVSRSQVYEIKRIDSDYFAEE